MGQTAPEKAGTLQDAGCTVQRARLEAEAHSSRFLRPYRHTTRRTLQRATRTPEGGTAPHRDLFPQLGQVDLGGQGNRVLP